MRVCDKDIGTLELTLLFNQGFNNEFDAHYQSGWTNNETGEFLTQYMDGKQIFVSDAYCVWWHREFRHWWIGDCQNVGTNSGYAYIDSDERCPIAPMIQVVPDKESGIVLA